MVSFNNKYHNCITGPGGEERNCEDPVALRPSMSINESKDDTKILAPVLNKTK